MGFCRRMESLALGSNFEGACAGHDAHVLQRVGHRPQAVPHRVLELPDGVLVGPLQQHRAGTGLLGLGTAARGAGWSQSSEAQCCQMPWSLTMLSSVCSSNCEQTDRDRFGRESHTSIAWSQVKPIRVSCYGC